ncbi:MAG: hypothetical protein R3B67_02170 [Phycisphaerales bacterium]
MSLPANRRSRTPSGTSRPSSRSTRRRRSAAGDRANERERIIFDQLCERARKHLDGWASSATSSHDRLPAGFATKASQRGWVRLQDRRSAHHRDRSAPPGARRDLEVQLRPQRLHARPGSLARNPRVDHRPQHGRQEHSTSARTLLVVLAQSGSFCAAARDDRHCHADLHARGADDAPDRGQSTFMVEMIETANILNHADERSLVILDEIGRGTSTLDGLSLAWAISEWLAEHQPRTLFATHYHEITELESRLEDRVKNLHVAVREWTSEDGNQEIAFLHSIRAGRADQSYGIHVAQLAGVPRQVTQRAKAVLESLSVEHAGRVDTKQVQAANKSAASAQMSLFTEFVQHPVVDSLKELKLDAMTPMQAFDALRAMQSQANDSSN